RLCSRCPTGPYRVVAQDFQSSRACFSLMGMIPRVARFLILFVFVVPGRTTFAQSLPTTLPTASTAPATTSAPARYELSIPAGFVKVTVNDRNAICEAADEPWVRETLAAVGPATRPTTM